MTLTIGVDVGGTKIATGLVDADGTILTSLRRPTPAQEVDAVVDVIADAVAELAAGRDARDAGGVEAVGIGAAGFVDAARSTVIFAPNLAWRDEPLAATVSERTGLPVVVENDANAAAWGEFRFGAARDAHSSLVITVGTGIGGGIVLDDRLVRGSHGFAAEIGHINIKPGGRRCGCGLRGCWERYGSGSALVHEARELATVSPVQGAKLLKLAGGDPGGITGLHVTQAAREGDNAAIEVFDTVGKWIGHGLADMVATLDPEVVVLAGGVSEAGELLRKPAQRTFEKNLTARSFRAVPQIRLATLGNMAGIVGAADLARER